jgi:hypothetical protein
MSGVDYEYKAKKYKAKFLAKQKEYEALVEKLNQRGGMYAQYGGGFSNEIRKHLKNEAATGHKAIKDHVASAKLVKYTAKDMADGMKKHLNDAAKSTH